MPRKRKLTQRKFSAIILKGSLRIEVPYPKEDWTGYDPSHWLLSVAATEELVEQGYEVIKFEQPVCGRLRGDVWASQHPTHPDVWVECEALWSSDMERIGEAPMKRLIYCQEKFEKIREAGWSGRIAFVLPEIYIPPPHSSIRRRLPRDM